MAISRERLLKKHRGSFGVYGDLAVSSFERLCNAVNPILGASDEQCCAAVGELQQRWVEKLEARHDAPPSSQRPRVQFLDLATYLNSCQPLQ